MQLDRPAKVCILSISMKKQVEDVPLCVPYMLHIVNATRKEFDLSLITSVSLLSLAVAAITRAT
jgi:hypothetical protein